MRPDEATSILIVVTDEGMGQGEPELRQKLIRIYFKMLLENGSFPWAICFYGAGVKLTIQGSPVLDLLDQLEDKGVLLISCLTCLNHYSLTEKVAVGVIGGMHDIVAAQWQADKVITL
jgi:selenium metabolism protein YedF